MDAPRRTRFSPKKPHPWTQLARRFGAASLAAPDSFGKTTGTASSSSSVCNGRPRPPLGEKVADDEPQDDLGCDLVVLDQSLAPEAWGRNSDVGGGGQTGTNTGRPGGTNHLSETSSFRQANVQEAMGLLGPCWVVLRWQFWPLLLNYLNPAFASEKEEEDYQREVWSSQKITSIFGAFFFVITWLLSFAIPRPWSVWNEVQNYVLGPIFTLPLIPAVLWDFPHRRPRLWNLQLVIVGWGWPTGSIIDMKSCGYYTTQQHCGERDFQSSLLFAVALPTIALFALGQKRLYSAAGGLCWLVITVSTIVPVRHAYLRNVTNVLLFTAFLSFTHFKREVADRRMYTLRAELKVQFRAKQRAQISERKSNDSKRRFTSYIFHEVRVPLNTALLAVQNMEGSQPSLDQDGEEEFAALRGSLAMMSTVLNDVLDFTRMERGGFTSVSRPFSFHDVMRSIFAPLKLDATARGLELETSLDLRIDQVAKNIAAGGFEGVAEEGEGIVLGDELRLRQVVNNLTSNACKFTEAGGKVSVVTTLIYPPPVSALSPDVASPLLGEMKHSHSESNMAKLSANRLAQHERKMGHSSHGPGTPSVSTVPAKQVVVVRIEVKDTGVGIRTRDLVDQRLFSAYVQTETGRLQGGKGTGLGLSLVRQIVLLSGGRLGVKSRFGEGSTFWVELALPIAPVLGNSMGATTGGTSSSAAGTEPSDFRFLPSLAERTAVLRRDMLAGQEEKRVGGGGDGMPRTYRFSSPPASPKMMTTPSYPPAVYNVPQIPIPTCANSSDSTDSSSRESSIEFTTPRPPAAFLGASLGDLTGRPRRATTAAMSALPPLTTTLSTTSTSSAYSSTLHKASSLSSKPARLPVAFGPLGPLRVLIVDDDPLTRKLMSRLMVRLGCVATTAENGQVALDLILARDENDDEGEDATKQVKYDLICLDNAMPICSGPEVVQRIRALGRSDLIVGVTANALIADQQSYLALGASYVLTKPVLEVDLRRMLGIAVAQRDLRCAAPSPETEL